MKEELTVIKISKELLVELTTLKNQLNLKSIKATIQHLFTSYKEQPINTEPAITRAKIRSMQQHIIAMCQQIREKLDEDIAKENGAE